MQPPSLALCGPLAGLPALAGCAVGGDAGGYVPPTVPDGLGPAPTAAQSALRATPAPQGAPADFQRICLANAGNPAAQEAAFRADPAYRATPPATFGSGARYVTFLWPERPLSAGTVVTDSVLDAANGCSVTRDGVTWRLAPDGGFSTSKR